MLKRHLDLHLYMHFMQNLLFFNIKPIEISFVGLILPCKQKSRQNSNRAFIYFYNSICMNVNNTNENKQKKTRYILYTTSHNTKSFFLVKVYGF